MSLFKLLQIYLTIFIVFYFLRTVHNVLKFFHILENSKNFVKGGVM